MKYLGISRRPASCRARSQREAHETRRAGRPRRRARPTSVSIMLSASSRAAGEDARRGPAPGPRGAGSWRARRGCGRGRRTSAACRGRSRRPRGGRSGARKSGDAPLRHRRAACPRGSAGVSSRGGLGRAGGARRPRPCGSRWPGRHSVEVHLGGDVVGQRRAARSAARRAAASSPSSRPASAEHAEAGRGRRAAASGPAG